MEGKIIANDVYVEVWRGEILAALVFALSCLDLSEAESVTIPFFALAFVQLYQVFNKRDVSARFLDTDVTRNA